ncbi:MAG TPA: glycosyltransferase family 4 protein [Solirubrobacteraceae bacterium]|nr:glycosyltransferase family 4 protein [Solirubrobacteraceae bacterium]
MPGRSLRIAWLGPVPGGESGVRGAAAELLFGLAQLGHRIDCFFPSAGHPVPQELAEHQQLTFVWGTSVWKWNRWYSRTKLGAFASGLLARARAGMRLRREIIRRHELEPYDLIYQFSSIETPAVPSSLTRSLPLVIHPETHIAGELRWLIAERRLALRCQPAYAVATVAAIMALRTLVQRVAIRKASLLICISAVFRDHLVHDYGFPLARTVVVPNPVRLDRFTEVAEGIGTPPRVLVLGRICVRKGVESVVAAAQKLLERGVEVHIRVLGNPSLWSDYTKLLEDLPPENSQYAGHLPAAEIPAELAHSDILLQASKYEPFGLTVAEALAAGVPVVATTEVGAREGVDGSVLSEVAPGDVEGMTSAIAAMIERLRASPGETRAMARAEARRLFASERVCEQISDALQALVGDHEPS